MIRCLVSTPIVHDACSYYRGLGIMKNLQRLFKELTNEDLEYDVFEKLGKVNWSDMVRYDFVFFERPYAPNHFSAIRYALDLKIPVWVDYDDNLFEVPRYNPAFDVYENARQKKAITDILTMATAVSVTTQHLSNYIQKMATNTPIGVIENAINDDLHDIPEQGNYETINWMWRGSSTHSADIEKIKDKLFYLHDKVNLHFYGFAPTYGQEIRGTWEPTLDFTYHAPTDIMHYFKEIKQIAPKYVLCPLVRNEFNFAKSNIGLLEAVMCGAVPIVMDDPDFVEWQLPGVYQIKDIEALQRGVSKDEYLEHYQTIRNHVTENYLLSKVNIKRVEMIVALLNAKK